MLPFLVVVAFAVGDAHGHPSPEPAPRAAAAIVEALQRDEHGAFAPLGLDYRRRESWSGIIELIERYDCIEIDRYAIGPGAGDRIHPLTIDGRAVTSGPLRRPVVLPKRWLMRLDEQGLVVSIELAETALARALKFATDAERDRVIAARGDLDPALIARELGQVAAYGFETGVHPPAAEYAVALARRLRDRRTEAECLRLLSTANHNRGMGLAAAEESLLVSIEAGSSDDIAASIFKIGIARWTAGDLRGAVDLLLTSARLIDTADDPRICLKSLYMASYVSQIGHDFRGGLVAAERVEQLSRKYGWTEGEAGGASLLGTIHRGLRNYDIAIAHYQRAAKIAEAIHNPIHRASAMASIAECELKRGNVAAAKAAADRAGAEAVTALTRFAIDMHVARSSPRRDGSRRPTRPCTAFPRSRVPRAAGRRRPAPHRSRGARSPGGAAIPGPRSSGPRKRGTSPSPTTRSECTGRPGPHTPRPARRFALWASRSSPWPRIRAPWR